MALKIGSDQSVEYLRMQDEVAIVGMTGCGGKVLSGTAANLALELLLEDFPGVRGGLVQEGGPGGW